jgi:hypothetical protein
MVRRLEFYAACARRLTTNSAIFVSVASVLASSSVLAQTTAFFLGEKDVF